MKTSNCSAVFCILARDCRENLFNNIPIIEKMRTAFTESRVIVVENGSTDGTTELLDDWAGKAEDVVVLHPDEDELARLDRIRRIAFCRNVYMQEADKFEADYLILADGDVCLTEFDIKNVLEKAPSDAVAVLANGQYYRVRANGRKTAFSYYDLFAYVRDEAESVYLTHDEIMDQGRDIRRKLRENCYVPVRSAFGGFGIYKKSAARGLRYEVKPNDRNATNGVLCEHIPFNEGAAKYGKLYVCRDMLLFYEQIPAGSVVTNFCVTRFGIRFYNAVAGLAVNKKFLKPLYRRLIKRES